MNKPEVYQPLSPAEWLKAKAEFEGRFRVRSMQPLIDKPDFRRKDGLGRHAHSVMLMQRKRALRRLGFKTLNDYLASPAWAAFRSDILAERKACEDCGTGQGLQLHHISYSRLGNERSDDIRVLCRPCHEKSHGRRFKTDTKAL